MSGAANPDAQRAWDGEGGAYWARHHDAFDASMAAYLDPLLDGAQFTATDRVLDIGCGNGITTLAAARRAHEGHALGADLSAAMLAVARERADRDGIRNVDFEQVDAQVHQFAPAGHDVVISRFGVMFFADPSAAFANLGHAVRPGGRLAMMVWQGLERNEWVSAPATALAAGRALPTPPPGAPGPLALADPDRIRGLLTEASFRGVELTEVSAPMLLGADVDSAFALLAGMSLVRSALTELDDAARPAALDALRSTIEAHLTANGAEFAAAAWLVTAVRH